MRVQHFIRSIGVLVFVMSSCTRLDSNITTLNGNHVIIVGHGGGGVDGFNSVTQLNSFAGLSRAIREFNLEGVEMDLQMTADSVLFLFHDDHLDNQSHCSGCIAGTPSSVISNCMLRVTNANAMDPEPISTLEQLLVLANERANRPRVFLDIHPPDGCIDNDAGLQNYHRRMIREIDRLATKYDYRDQLSIQSIDREMLQYAKQYAPYLDVFLDYCRNDADIEYAVANSFDGVAGQSEVLSAEFVASAHRSKLLVQIFGANTQGAIIETLNKSPDYFIASNLLLTMQIASQMK